MAGLPGSLCIFPLFSFQLPPISIPPDLTLPIPNFIFSIDFSCPLD
jgi:hypothetical protein